MTLLVPRRVERGIVPIVLGLAFGGCSVMTSLDGLTGGDGLDADGALDATAASDGASGAIDARAPADASDAGGGAIDVTAPDVVASDAGGDGAADAPGVACESGTVGNVLSASMTTQPAGWTFNGSARYNASAPSAQLTPAATIGQVGSFVYGRAIPIDDVDVQFQFRIGLQGGARSDGMGFVLEADGPTALGNGGGGLGMAGLTGYGVELDIYDNGVCGDSSDDHVAVDDLALCSQQNQSPRALYTTDVSGLVDLADTHWHTAHLVLVNGSMSVNIDGMQIVTAVPLVGFQRGTPYYLGFTAATGNATQPDGGPGGYRHEVKSVVVTFPSARCL